MKRPRQWNSSLPVPRSGLRRSQIRSRRKKSAAARRRGAERREADFERTYHSEERVAFVKFAGPCEVPGCDGRPDNAHLTGGGKGTGRKGHYTRIVRLCRRHHQILDDMLGSVEAFDAHHGTRLEAAAIHLDQHWQKDGPGWIAAVKADGSYEAMRAA